MVSGDEVELRVGPTRPYVYFRGFPAGEYAIRSYVLVNFMGSAVSRTLDLQKLLVLEKGRLALFPYKVVMVARPSPERPGSSVIYMNLEFMDREQETRIRQSLSQDPNFSLWAR